MGMNLITPGGGGSTTVTDENVQIYSEFYKSGQIVSTANGGAVSGASKVYWLVSGASATYTLPSAAANPGTEYTFTSPNGVAGVFQILRVTGSDTIQSPFGSSDNNYFGGAGVDLIYLHADTVTYRAVGTQWQCVKKKLAPRMAYTTTNLTLTILYQTVLVSAAGGNRTITLPSGGNLGYYKGWEFEIIKTGATNSVIVGSVKTLTADNSFVRIKLNDAGNAWEEVI